MLPQPPRVGWAPPPRVGEHWTIAAISWNALGVIEVLFAAPAPPDDPDQSPRVVWVRLTAIAAVGADNRPRPLQWDLRRLG